jgi:hypothetical protein
MFMEVNKRRAVLLGAVCSCLLALAAASLAQPKPAATGNLYQMLQTRKDIMWRPANPELPQDVCSLFSTCDDSKPSKMVAMPQGTVDGHTVQRAITWTHMKGKDAFVLVRLRPHSEAYYFLLAPDGSLSKTAYLEQGKPFFLIANSTGQSKFDKDKSDWMAYLMKSGAPAK